MNASALFTSVFNMSALLIIKIVCVILCFADYTIQYRIKNDDNTPIVQIDQGALKGVTKRTDGGSSYNVFYSIPYAKPPVGELRFKAPEPADGWEGVRDSTAPGPFCSQLSADEPVQFSGQEDCLYLNVYTPKIPNESAPLSVLLWVHGGAFVRGLATRFDPKHLLEKNIVVVTINYRLDIFGFLALNDSEIPGNAALKDIILATSWIKHNIKYFGGDREKITIFGQSAGATLVHLVTMSPVGKGLFEKAIIHSGSAVSERRIQDNPERVVKEFKAAFNIYSNETKEILNILGGYPADEILYVANKMEKDGRQYAFRPVVEKIPSKTSVITEHPRIMMENGQYNRIPILSGHLSHEGMYLLPPDSLENVSTAEEAIEDFEILIPDVLRDVLTPEDKIVVADKIKHFYFPDNNDLAAKFIDVMSDYDYIKDIDKYVREFSKHIPNIFYFHFSYHGEFNWNRYAVDYNYTGAAHSDELGYLFDSNADIASPTERDYLVRRRMVEMWTNFVKYGNPTFTQNEDEAIDWKPVRENESNCLHINEDLTLERDILQRRLQFWRDLEESYKK